MKRTGVSLLFCVFQLVLFAQNEEYFATNRGNLGLAGGLYFGSHGNDLYNAADGSRQLDFTINPAVQVFVAPSLAIGIKTLMSYSKGYSSNYTSFGFGPQLTYYIAGHKLRKVYPYIDVAAVARFSSSAPRDESEISSSGYNNFYIDSDVGAGVLFMMSRAVGIYTELGYYNSSVYREDGSSNAGNTISFSVGVKFFVITKKLQSGGGGGRQAKPSRQIQ